MTGEQLLEDYRIGEGGPLRRFETACHLTSLRRQIALVVMVGWVPVVALALWNQLVNGRPEPMLRHASVHVRLLVAAPVFLVLDRLFPRVCRHVLAQLWGQSFVPQAAKPRFDRVLRSAARLADSPLPEVLLALISIGFGASALFGILPAVGLTHPRPQGAAELWYAVTDLPLFEFLLWRSLWRWAIWVRILVGLSRIRLDLVPTHPDRCGGIGFLRLPSIAYCGMFLFAVSSVISAELPFRFAVGSTLAAFKPLLLVFVVVGALVAFGPLLLFAPRLIHAHHDGLVEFGGMAAGLGRRLRTRCTEGSQHQHPANPDEIQELAALGMTYREEVDRLRPLLFDKGDMLFLLAATLLPTVPVMLVSVPIAEWMKLAGALTGGWEP